MTKYCARIVLLACAVGCLSDYAKAAPLDDLLTADTPAKGMVRLEGGYDAVNNTLDVFKVRANDPVYGGTDVGNYSGEHILAGYALTDRWWVDGGLWDRHITYHSNVETLQSWQAALQYRFAGTPDSGSSYGLRLSAWGDGASDLNKSSSTTLFGQQLTSVDVSNPSDSQLQADLLGSWKPAEHLELAALAGGGVSSVSVDELVAGYNHCQYDVSLNGSSISASEIGQCTITSFTITQSGGTDLSNSLSYKANFMHVGLNWRWNYARWTVKGGYLQEAFNREGVDTVVTHFGGTAYKRNNILDGDISYLVAHHTDVFVRAEVMSNQLLGEVPFAYNAFTASKFNGKYGLMTFGVRATF